MRSVKNIVVFIITILMLPLIYGCATSLYVKIEQSARLDYQAGNYDLALIKCVNSLKIKSGYTKSQSLVKDSFSRAVAKHENRIKELDLSYAKFKWDEIVIEYNALMQINDTIKSLPTIIDKWNDIISFELKDYTEDIIKAKTNAAETHYQEGKLLFQDLDIESQKLAAKEFRKVQEYCLGYKDSAELYEKAKHGGVKRVAIMPFEDKTGRINKYSGLSDIITDDVMSNLLHDNNAMEFLEIISRDQIEKIMQEQSLAELGVIDSETFVEIGKILGVHELITGKITQIIYNQPTTVDRLEGRENTIITGTEKYTAGYIGATPIVLDRPVYGKVNANITIYTRKSSASISGSYTIIDVKTGKVKKVESFMETEDYVFQWATFVGDGRALNRNDAILVLKTEETTPSEEEMVTKSAKKLAMSLFQALRDYAR